MELTDRQRMILGLVIREYIQYAAPVGSRVLVEKYPLGIGPATARNELAALEESGYLTHPHTSAGRVPTEKGYRYFVEYLMQQGELPLEERLTIRHQFHQVNTELDQMMRLSASVLAQQTHTAALVTPPRASQNRFKHLELISLRDAVALLILVLRGGMVRQQVLTLDAPRAQDSLTALAGKLNHLCSGATAEQIRIDAAADALEAQVSRTVRDLMVQEDRQASQEIYRDGLGYMLDLPEFREMHSLRQVVDLLEQGMFFGEMLAETMERGGVQVIIGGEGRWEELSDCSVVVARYGGESPVSGTLGIVGPTRMPYAHAISVVRYVAELMGDLIYDWYGY
jgi:heat-inducible transcriptional repressor